MDGQKHPGRMSHMFSLVGSLISQRRGKRKTAAAQPTSQSAADALEMLASGNPAPLDEDQIAPLELFPPKGQMAHPGASKPAPPAV